MSESKRFEFYSDDYVIGVLDNVSGKTLNHFATIDLLNEQQVIIERLKEENKKLKKRLKKCANNWKQEIVERGKLEEETMIMRDYYESQTATRED